MALNCWIDATEPMNDSDEGETADSSETMSGEDEAQIKGNLRSVVTKMAVLMQWMMLMEMGVMLTMRTV